MNLPKSSEEYKDLKEITDPWGIVYGPIQSRRAGLSLGVNLLGDENKICSYDCPYCELGFTEMRMNKIRKEARFPEMPKVITELRQKLQEIISSGRSLDSISVVGNGEPTLYPQFSEVTQEIIQARDDIASQTRLLLFTNGTGLENKKNIQAARSYDQVMVKVDAGNDELLKKVNAPLIRMTISKLLQTVRKLERYTIQSCFFRGAIDNTGREDIEDWIEVIAMLHPEEIHIYTIDRIPAMSGLQRADEDTLDIISQKVAKRTEAKVLTF